jgi:hypothetical protein
MFNNVTDENHENKEVPFQCAALEFFFEFLFKIISDVFNG